MYKNNRENEEVVINMVDVRKHEHQFSSEICQYIFLVCSDGILVTHSEVFYFKRSVISS